MAENTSNNFKKEVLNVVLPSIKRMIEKEKNHISYLKEELKKYESYNKKFLFQIDTEIIKTFIKTSEDSLLFLEKRQKEFENFSIENS